MRDNAPRGYARKLWISVSFLIGTRAARGDRIFRSAAPINPTISILSRRILRRLPPIGLYPSLVRNPRSHASLSPLISVKEKSSSFHGKIIMSADEIGQAIYSVREGSHEINRTLIKDPAVLNKAPLYRCYRVTRYRILSEFEDAFLLSSRSLLIRPMRDRRVRGAYLANRAVP
jgi:hypothetical protein